MPTYVYEGSLCGEQEAVQHRMSESFTGVLHADCPSAGDCYLTRIYTPPAVSFKGSGFYSTDKD